MSTLYRIFCVVAPGLESAAQREAASLGLSAEVQPGGIACRGDAATLLRAVHELRIPDGVRVRVGRFPARDFEALEAGLARIPWHAWVPDAGSDVRVTCKKSRLYHSGAVAERVQTALASTRPAAPDTGSAAPRVFIRIARDQVSVSVDATGEEAHKRGWPRWVGKAGLRETLAAGVLQMSGLLEAKRLWDPFCGAGTLGMEWLAARRGEPVFGSERQFAYQRWPAFRSPDGSSERASPMPATLWLTDRDGAATDAARRNVAARGWSEAVTVETADVRAYDGVPAGTAVVANLPYGKRLEHARPALAAFAEALRERPDLGPVVALDGTGRLAAITGERWERIGRFDNRGLTVHVERWVR